MSTEHEMDAARAALAGGIENIRPVPLNGHPQDDALHAAVNAATPLDVARADDDWIPPDHIGDAARKMLQEAIDRGEINATLVPSESDAAVRPDPFDGGCVMDAYLDSSASFDKAAAEVWMGVTRQNPDDTASRIGSGKPVTIDSDEPAFAPDLGWHQPIDRETCLAWFRAGYSTAMAEAVVKLHETYPSSAARAVLTVAIATLGATPPVPERSER